MKKDEMEIMRAACLELDPETVFVVTYQYHTEKDPDDPEGKRNLRAASRYRTLGMIARKTDLEALALDANRMENRLRPWKWPNDPSWAGCVLYMKDSSMAGFANWLRLKLKKAIPWEDGIRLLAGYKKDTRKGSPTFGKYCIFNANAVYDLKGYETASGEKIDLDDREALLRHVGENVWKEIRMKLVGWYNASPEAAPATPPPGAPGSGS